MVYKGYNKTYDFRKFRTIRVLGNEIRNNIINTSTVTAYLSGYTGRICLRLNLYFQHIKKLLQSKKGNINITMYK